MSAVFHDVLGGEWIEGIEAFANIHPSETSHVIGHQVRTEAAGPNAAVAAARAALPAFTLA